MCIKGKCIFEWLLHHNAWAEHVGIYDVCANQSNVAIIFDPNHACPVNAYHHTILPTDAIGWPVFNGHKQKPEMIQTVRMQGTVSDAGTTMKLVIGVTYL